MATKRDTVACILDNFPDHSSVDYKDNYYAALKLAVTALAKIADCNESDLAKYCAKVDSIAVDALVKLECMS